MQDADLDSWRSQLRPRARTWVFSGVFLPVSAEGSARTAMKQIVHLLSRGNQPLLFEIDIVVVWIFGQATFGHRRKYWSSVDYGPYRSSMSNQAAPGNGNQITFLRIKWSSATARLIPPGSPRYPCIRSQHFRLYRGVHTICSSKNPVLNDRGFTGSVRS